MYFLSVPRCGGWSEQESAWCFVADWVGLNHNIHETIKCRTLFLLLFLFNKLLLKGTTISHFAVVVEITSVRVQQIQQQVVRESLILAYVSCQGVQVCGEAAGQKS